MKQFTFSEIWNESVSTEDRPMVKREHCWASELGQPLVDRYLKMNAVKPTNPPNTRSRRKFFAGNVWEFIAGVVLNQMGIIQEGQERVEVDEYALKVTGKLDYKIGGIPNYKLAREAIKRYTFFDDAMQDRFMKAIDNFEANFGEDEIEGIIYEMKSCSEYVLEKVQGGGNIPGHDLQLWHYLKGLKMPAGRIAYISKNDALMVEREILLSDKVIASTYEDGLTELKGYLDAGEQPPLPPLIVFEGRFSKNFGIEYSSYLHMLYGFERPDQYSDEVSPKVMSWNRVLKRMRDIHNGVETPSGKEMLLTDKNKEAIEAMHEEGHDANKLWRELVVFTQEEND